MLDFPEALTLKQLEAAHAEHAAILPTLHKIDDLCAGGHQIEAKKALYLKPRPGEEPELYKLRLEKFVYTNILGDAITSQVQKLSSGSLTVTGIEQADFWKQFRENTNRQGRSEKSLLEEIFEVLLQFKCAYLHVEKPYSQYTPQNRKQEELLGLLPYVCVYTPLEVINWGKDKTGGLSWLKLRQVEDVSDPFGQTKKKVVWTLIDERSIAKYEAFVKLNAKGQIAEIVNEKGEPLGSGEDAKIFRSLLIAHGVGRLPIVKVSLSDNLWVADQAYLLALEHLNLENSRYDTAMMAGYVQRTWQPHLAPDTDLDRTFVDVPEDLKTGNQYVIKGSFQFNEAQGSSIGTVSGLLQGIKDTIEDMIGTARASTTKGAVQQSGVSKAMDFSLQESALKKYGAILCDAYQDLLQLVAKVHGVLGDEISVTGLDTFDVDSLEGLLGVAVTMAPVEGKIAPTALMLFYQALQGQLVKNASAEQQQTMISESEQLWAAQQEIREMARQAQAQQLQQPQPLDAPNK